VKTWRAALLRHETILAAVVVVEVVYFSSLAPRFATADNACDIVRHSVEIGLLALVMTPISLAGGIDLSLGSLLGLCAILFGKFWRDGGLPLPAAGLCTLGAGGLAGGLNALLIARFGLPPLIVTLGTYSLFRGLAEALTRGVDTFTGFPAAFLFLGQERILGIPAQAPLFAAAAVAVWLLVHRMSLGRSLRAIGFSAEGARHAGIPVERRVGAVYVLAGVVTALAALVYTSRLGQAKADAGTGYELFAITAAVLGGTSIFGGVGTVHGTLSGVAAIAVCNNGLVHARQPREVAGMLTGLLLITALSAPKLARLLMGRKA
jgi:ribose/xylose/arabinose/galactoside ABC-type transport system permease subunit